MPQSNSKTLASVYSHPALLAVGAVLLFVTLAPATIVARIAWHLAFAYFCVVALDIALTKYHLWTFTPTVPQPKRFALITGGSTGIGREMAFQLAAKGYSLVLVARTQSALEKTQREILALQESRSGHQIEVLILPVDLASSAGIQRVIDFATEKKLVVDILINNAFVTHESLFPDLSVAQIDAAVTLNVLAATKLSHFFTGEMVKRGVGRVLNVSSIAAYTVTPMHALYSSTKVFMLNLSLAMNYELRGSGVTVTCYCPGPVTTNFCDSMKYLCFKVNAIDAKTCATHGLDGMFSAEMCFHDTYTSHISGMIARVVLPPRLRACLGAVSLNEPHKALSLIKR